MFWYTIWYYFVFLTGDIYFGRVQHKLDTETGSWHQWPCQVSLFKKTFLYSWHFIFSAAVCWCQNVERDYFFLNYGQCEEYYTTRKHYHDICLWLRNHLLPVLLTSMEMSYCHLLVLQNPTGRTLNTSGLNTTVRTQSALTEVTV